MPVLVHTGDVRMTASAPPPGQGGSSLAALVLELAMRLAVPLDLGRMAPPRSRCVSTWAGQRPQSAPRRSSRCRARCAGRRSRPRRGEDSASG
ncbi:hypothetical protein WME75_32305 [Sorangium sp. So ce1014]|uniref:hypothetical protein n=1 Tax=Sorangium sp. So ce1014 TaxID=3133326 RepID=UPI003F62648D